MGYLAGNGYFDRIAMPPDIRAAKEYSGSAMEYGIGRVLS